MPGTTEIILYYQRVLKARDDQVYALETALRLISDHYLRPECKEENRGPNLMIAQTALMQSDRISKAVNPKIEGI